VTLYAIEDKDFNVIMDFQENSDIAAVNYFNARLLDMTLKNTDRMYIYNEEKDERPGDYTSGWKLVYTYVPNPNEAEGKSTGGDATPGNTNTYEGDQTPTVPDPTGKNPYTKPEPTVPPTVTPAVDYWGTALFILGLGLVGLTLWFVWRHREGLKHVAETVVMAPAHIANKIEGGIKVW